MLRNQRSMGSPAAFAARKIPLEVEQHYERWYKFDSLESADFTQY